MKKKRAQTLSPEHYKTSAPEEKSSNMLAPTTRTAVPTYITHKTESPTVAAKPAYSVFEGAAGYDLLTRQIDRVRLEHGRVMKEEWWQNCCLCGLLAVSIFVAAALLTVAFYDRTMSLGSANWTESDEIGSSIYFDDVESNPEVKRRSFHTGRNINNYTKVPLNYTRTLKNLTEFCASKIEPRGCFYHKNVYPDNCVTTRCNSIIVNILTREYPRPYILFDHMNYPLDSSSWGARCFSNQIQFVWHYTHELMTIAVEDWTPCAPGKLCIGGQCVEHPDAAYYVVPKAHPGGVRLMCKSSGICIRIDGRLIEPNSAQRFMSCENRSCDLYSRTFTRDLVRNQIAVRFLSCSNPYPVEMDPGCFPRIYDLTSEFMPFVMYDFCFACVWDFSEDSCSKPIDNFPSMFPTPCQASGTPKIRNTFCAGFRACVPLYKDYPETYNLRPIQKC